MAEGERRQSGEEPPLAATEQRHVTDETQHDGDNQDGAGLALHLAGQHGDEHEDGSRRWLRHATEVVSPRQIAVQSATAHTANAATRTTVSGIHGQPACGGSVWIHSQTSST